MVTECVLLVIQRARCRRTETQWPCRFVKNSRRGSALPLVLWLPAVGRRHFYPQPTGRVPIIDDGLATLELAVSLEDGTVNMRDNAVVDRRVTASEDPPGPLIL